MRADVLSIKHALEKCLEDCLWQDGMECVSSDPEDTEIITINNKERIQELDIAIKAIDAIEKELS